jgi:hypothetical protein
MVFTQSAVSLVSVSLGYRSILMEMSFDYKARNLNGELITGKIEADTRQAAIHTSTPFNMVTTIPCKSHPTGAKIKVSTREIIKVYSRTYTDGNLRLINDLVNCTTSPTARTRPAKVVNSPTVRKSFIMKSFTTLKLLSYVPLT